MRTRVKICGITSLQDALQAVEAGVDALGFVFYANSPRYIQPKHAAEIIRNIPVFITTVALFVNERQAVIDEIVEQCSIDVLQLHGQESPDFCAKQTRRVIKALPISQQEDIAKISAYSCTVLLDAKAPAGVHGGVGKTFDWSLLTDLKHDFPLVLAGGLDSANIDEALGLRKWFAVDVSSGVELAKGIKDAGKLVSFCKKIYEFNSRV